MKHTSTPPRLASASDGWETIHGARHLLTRERTDAEEARRWFLLACALAVVLCATFGAFLALLIRELSR